MIYSNESLIRLFPKVPLFHCPKGSWIFFFFFFEGNDPLQALTPATAAYTLILGLLTTGCGNKLATWKFKCSKLQQDSDKMSLGQF